MQYLVLIILGISIADVASGQSTSLIPATTRGSSDIQTTNLIGPTTRPVETSSILSSQTIPAFSSSPSAQPVQSVSSVVASLIISAIPPSSSLAVSLSPGFSLVSTSSLSGSTTTLSQETRSSTPMSSSTSTTPATPPSSDLVPRTTSARDIGIGVGIGLVCAVFLVGITAWLLTRRFRRRNKQDQLEYHNGHSQHQMHDTIPIPVAIADKKTASIHRMSELESPTTNRYSDRLISSDKDPAHEVPAKVVRVKSKIAVELP